MAHFKEIGKIINEAIEKEDLKHLKGMFKSTIAEYSNTQYKTPLMYACELGHLEIVKYLCEIIDVNEVDSTNSSALTYATIYGRSDIVIYLCQNGADPNIERTDGENAGQTPLMYACWKCNYDAVAALIDAGAKVNVSRKHGDRFTPLMYAMSNIHGVDSKRRIIKLLIQSDANVIATDSDGDTIYDFPGAKDILYMPPSQENNERNAEIYAPGGEAFLEAQKRFEEAIKQPPKNSQRKRKRKTRKTRRKSTRRRNHST